MSKKTGIELSQQELNDLYYCIETINRKDFRPDMSERLNLLGDKIGEEVYKLAKQQTYQEWVEKQLEEDKLNHEMNFKRAFARHGDY
jgi:Fe-S cluster biosynthesis and repair protein YggX